MQCIGNQAGSGQFRLRWQRPDGVTETLPASALRARHRRDDHRFGGAVLAVREGVPSAAAIRPVTYLFGDYLGSSSLATNASGAVVAETRYKPYGEIRWSSGAMPTDFGDTGQRLEKAGYVGSLMDYVARAYSPVLGRFVSADTIVPGAGNPQALNRFAYVLNSPLGFVDPSGHDPLDAAWEAAFRAAHGRDPNDSQIVLWWSDGGGGGRAYNPPDVALGKVALRHGANLASGKISMSEVASAMMFALDANGGLWPPNSPGAR